MSLLWKCELISKNSFEFLKFFANFDTVVTYHNLLLEVYVIHTRRRKITITIFFWNFGIVPATQTFFLCFHRITEPTTFTPAVIVNPLFTQNVLGLTFVLSMVFIADFFPWLHVKRFLSADVRQFCLRLRVIERSVGIVISHL